MVTKTPLLADAVAASGGHARPPAGPSDMVDGVEPGVVVEPTDVSGLAAVLAWASRSKRSVVLRGNGTKDSWGRPPTTVDVLLRTGGLRRVVAHEAADLTATFEAGARLRDVNRDLARAGQHLPIDPPHEDATIGGILAVNDSGPLRHRHGTPRDLVLGMTLVMPDGLIAASGGRVVKNVAGYDIGRLMAGSHGCLAAIATATFKLAPTPPATRTVRVHLGAPSDAVAFVDRVRHHQIEPEALDVHLSHLGQVDRTSVLVRFASVEPAVDEGVKQVQAIASELGASVDVSGGPQADGWWAAQRQVRSGTDRLDVRLSWKPADFARAADAILASTRGLDAELFGRAAVGSGILHATAEPGRQADVVRALRASPALGHVVILSAPLEVRRQVDVWGSDEATPAVWQALRAACDPSDTLGARRGPL